MRTKQTILKLLTGPADILWNQATKHEAILLLEATYRCHEDLREPLMDHVLKGPQREVREEDEEEEEAVEQEASVLEIIAYLAKQGLPLSSRAAQMLANARESDRPIRDNPPERVGMTYWVESGSIDRPATSAFRDIQSRPAGETVADLLQYEGRWDQTKRDFAEAVGLTCARHPTWAIEAWKALKKHHQSPSPEVTNPWFWGFRAGIGSIGDTPKEWVDNAKAIVDVWRLLIVAFPNPECWYSIPGCLIDFAKAAALSKDDTKPLVNDLAKLFLDFDFDRQSKDSEKPVEWLNAAINHPLGVLIEWQLNLAQDVISEEVRAGRQWQLGTHFLELFDGVASSTGRGARYGLCIMAHRLAWLEAVLPDWTEEKILPLFSWKAHPNRASAAWDGYLWGRGLSRLIKENFVDTYAVTALHIGNLGKEARKGLMSHIAGICWYEQGFVDRLKDIAAAVNKGDRAHLLEAWEDHLSSASTEDAECFTKSVLFPYWDWCQKQTFFTTPEGDSERRRFWDLVPYTGRYFSGACKRAQHARPSRAEGHYRLLTALGSGRPWDSPSDAVEFAICILDVTENPQWDKEQWLAIWKKATDLAPTNLDALRNALAKRDVRI